MSGEHGVVSWEGDSVPYAWDWHDPLILPLLAQEIAETAGVLPADVAIHVQIREEPGKFFFLSWGSSDQEVQSEVRNHSGAVCRIRIILPRRLTSFLIEELGNPPRFFRRAIEGRSPPPPKLAA